MKPRFRRRSFGVLLVPFALLAASCAESSPDAASSTEAGTAAAETVPIEIGLAAYTSFNTSAQYLQADPEFAKEHGLSIEWTLFNSSSPNCVAAILGGEINFCVAANPTPLSAVTEGADIQVVANTTRPFFDIVLKKSVADETGVSPDAPVEDRIEALKGLTFGMPAKGASQPTYVEATLQEVGSGMEDVEHVVIKDVLTIAEQMRQGRIDASVVSPGAFATPIEDGEAVVWLSLGAGEVPGLAELPLMGVWSTSDFVESNSEAVERLQGALEAASKVLHTEKASAMPLVQQKLFAETPNFERYYDESVRAMVRDVSLTEDVWRAGLEIQALAIPDVDWQAEAPFEEVVAESARKTE